MKVSNAVYDPTTQTLMLDYYEKEKNGNKTELPQLARVTLGNSTGKTLRYERSPLESNPDFGSRLTIYNVPSDWYYVRVYVSVKKLDTQKAPTLDEFGNTITYPMDIGKTSTYYMGVDHRDAEIQPSVITTITTPATALPEATSTPVIESYPIEDLPEETTVIPETTPAETTTTTKTEPAEMTGL